MSKRFFCGVSENPEAIAIGYVPSSRIRRRPRSRRTDCWRDPRGHFTSARRAGDQGARHVCRSEGAPLAHERGNGGADIPVRTRLRSDSVFHQPFSSEIPANSEINRDSTPIVPTTPIGSQSKRLSSRRFSPSLPSSSRLTGPGNNRDPGWPLSRWLHPFRGGLLPGTRGVRKRCGTQTNHPSFCGCGSVWGA